MITRRVGALKQHPLGSQPVNCGRLNPIVSIAAQVIRSKRVDGDQDHIRFLVSRMFFLTSFGG